MDHIASLIPLLIPVAVIQLALMIIALVDIIRREKTRGPKWVWAVIVIVFGYLGPVVYFVVGREE